MGRKEEAIKILRALSLSISRRTTDVVLLGEICSSQGNMMSLHQFAARRANEAGCPLGIVLAITYERMNQPKEAEHYLDLAKHRAPNNPEIVRSLAGFYRETGNYPAAIAALKSLVKKTPGIKAELAFTYQLAGKREEAAKLYVQAADAAPAT